jgi:hypothetical protein
MDDPMQLSSGALPFSRAVSTKTQVTGYAADPTLRGSPTRQ